MRLTPRCQTKFYVRAPLELQSLSPRTDFRCCIRPIYLLFTPGSYRHRGIQMLFILGLKRTLILKSIYWTVFYVFTFLIMFAKILISSMMNQNRSFPQQWLQMYITLIQWQPALFRLAILFLITFRAPVSGFCDRLRIFSPLGTVQRHPSPLHLCEGGTRPTWEREIRSVRWSGVRGEFADGTSWIDLSRDKQTDNYDHAT